MPKDKRYKTHGSRWGSGKVHRYVYDEEHQMWHVACGKIDPDHPLGQGGPRANPYGRVVDNVFPVTFGNPGCQ